MDLLAWPAIIILSGALSGASLESAVWPKGLKHLVLDTGLETSVADFCGPPLCNVCCSSLGLRLASPSLNLRGRPPYNRSRWDYSCYQPAVGVV